MGKTPTPNTHWAWVHGYPAAQSALATGLMAIHPDWTLFALLFFVLSGQAALVLTLQQNVAWIAGFVAISLFCG